MNQTNIRLLCTKPIAVTPEFVDYLGLGEKAIVYRFDEDGASNGGCSQSWICVDRTVHLVHFTSWQDQTGAEDGAFSSQFWGDITPCDGSCMQKAKLPPQALELVYKFIESRGVEKGEYSISTPMYPWAKYEEMLEMQLDESKEEVGDDIGEQD